MSSHNSSPLDPAIERRLREEARAGGVGPSPYLHTRIMAEVSGLHSEKMGRTRWRWVAALGGGVAVMLVAVVGLSLLAERRGGGSPIAGIHAAPPAAPSAREDAVALAQELQSTVNDPFATEIKSLETDVKRAASFLGDCLPL